MYKILLILAVFISAPAIIGQTTDPLRIVVKDLSTKLTIPGATVSVMDSDITSITDASGKASIGAVPPGERTIEIFSPGYEVAELKLTFPLDDTSERTVYLKINNNVGDVTITSTRTGREIEAEPSRIEAIDEEEIDEKISMRPANVSMVLHESTGIQVQQTSATSNTQSVRIQGLDGRYTQILKDGFPAFGGFSGSLSILEIPPLDLKQVEVIKGPAATLFGGGAIAGVVNFVSKDPENRPVTTIILNQTSVLGTDFSIFNSRKFEKIGYTFLGSANYQRRYDVDKDDFTELPDTSSFAVNPKAYFYLDDKSTITVGNSTSYQVRKGGDTFVLSGRADGLHQYFEENKTFRNITTFNLNRDFSNGGRLLAKQSLAFFNRDLMTQNYAFKGSQFNSFTDVSYSVPVRKHALVFGGSAVYDQFRESRTDNIALRDETRTTLGAFIQDTVDLTEKISLEAGFRIDKARDYGTFALPRVSLLYKFNDRFTSRVGFGLGYKTPSVFTEDAEELLFRNVAPIRNTLKAERSRGGTFDVNYKDNFAGKVDLSINQMFFYTLIRDPLVLAADANNIYRFSNSASSVISKGLETNARIGYGIARLFFGYTLTDAKAGYLSGDRSVTLIPRHKINTSLVFEKAESFKSGVEYYFGSRQTLDDRSKTRALGEVGLYGEKIFKKFSLFINAENLTDVRQGRYSRVVLGPHQDPTFAELYTHTEGRVLNGGIKIRL